MNTFRSTDSSITEEDTDGENASTAAASFRRDRLSIERLYGTTKLVETYFDDWEGHSAYMRESGAITIHLSSEGMKRSNLARALDEKLRSNAIHIELENSEFAEFTDLLKARCVVLVDGVNQDGQPASQDSMGSVTTASYREDDESRVFEQVEYNTSKIRGARRPQDNTEQSDDDADIASQDDGIDDEDGRTDVGLGEDYEGMAVDQEDSRGLPGIQKMLTFSSRLPYPRGRRSPHWANGRKFPLIITMAMTIMTTMALKTNLDLIPPLQRGGKEQAQED